MKAAALPLLAVLLLAAPPPAAAAQEPQPPALDPFYTSLLDSGIQAYGDGDFAAAAQDLRLACFGLLEEPPRLASCLTYLGLAQAGAGDREGFTDTFRRLVPVEKRFRGYSRADLPAEVRNDYEQRLTQWVRAEQLTDVEAFAPLAVRQRAASVALLTPAKRRDALGDLIAAEPDRPLWRLLLGDLEIDEGHPEAAVARAEEVLAAEPGNVRAHCLRGLGRARLGTCSDAVSDLTTCPGLTTEARLAEASLGCLVALGEADAARNFLASLPAELQKSKGIARLGRDVARLPKPGDEATVAPPVPAPEQVEAAPEPPTTAADPGEDAAPELLPDERQALERARQMLRDTRYAGELDEPLRLAREVADAHPDSREAQHLVAQIAYRASKWQLAAAYFRRGGDPGDDQPVLLFYMAVSFYEAGDQEAAAAALRRALPHLDKTAFVTRYVDKILGGSGDPR
jgi:tetratricopeptide (TPR) repeat protein